MKNNSKRLFMMEIVLCIVILFISLSVTNLIFARSMMQHQRNEAMMKMSEIMVMITEDIQSDHSHKRYDSEMKLYFDANGNRVETKNRYELKIRFEKEDTYMIYTLNLSNQDNEELLSWNSVKVVK